MRILVVAAAWAGLAGGCFSPHYADCEVQCASGSCPAGFSCDLHGDCRAQGADLTRQCTRPDAVNVDGPAGPDANGDAAPCSFGYQPLTVDPCTLPGPSLDWQIPPGTFTFDVDTGATGGGLATPPPTIQIPQSGGPDLRVMIVNNFDVQNFASLTVTGTHPLVVIAWGNATVAGTLDVSAASAGDGPGAAPLYCLQGAGGSGGTGAGGGGGGGGGFGAAGAAGKAGGGYLGVLGGSAGPAGGQQSDETLVPLRGGCAGGAGGNVSGSPNQGGSSGGGGGALAIVARSTLTVTASGSIRSGGGPGRHGDTSSNPGGGGGGGGSGGGILLEGETLEVRTSAHLCANGGGGGAGGDLGTTVSPAEPGGCSRIAASGAGGGDYGGNGATGASSAASPVNDATTKQGGGGGGGGVGRIRLRSGSLTVQSGAVVTPDPYTL